MSLSEAAWSEVRRAYQGNGETVAAIAGRLGISEGAIYRRARREGWARRSKVSQSNPKRVKNAPTRSKVSDATGPVDQAATRQSRVKKPRRTTTTAALKGEQSKAELIGRLYNAIDAKLERLENRMVADHDITAAESERETRELGSMIRSFEKVTAFAKTLQGRVDKQSRAATVDSSDAERMREEIAQRLERLCAQGDAQDKPGTPE